MYRPSAVDYARANLAAPPEKHVYDGDYDVNDDEDVSPRASLKTVQVGTSEFEESVI